MTTIDTSVLRLAQLAAGELHPNDAMELREVLLKDEDLMASFLGLQLLVKRLGVQGAVEHVDRECSRVTRELELLSVEPDLVQVHAAKGRPRQGMLMRLWPYALAAAACLALVWQVSLLFLRADPKDLALATLTKDRDYGAHMGAEQPDWVLRYSQGRYAEAIAEVHKSGATSLVHGRLILGYAFMRMQPPVEDSALYYLERVAEAPSPYQQDALACAAALAYQRGDLSKSKALLGKCSLQEAKDLLRALNDQ